MNKDAKIYVAGHTGLAGSAFYRKLKENGFTNIITRTHEELDITDQKAVIEFFKKEKPEYVFQGAAKVGGIIANDRYRGQFIYENLQIQNNIIHESYKNNVKKLIFLGSSCMYPKNCPQPMKEEYLLTNEFEYTNEAYATAKVAGMRMCEAYNLQYNTDFLPVMPTNLYGLNDNYDLINSHVLAALIRKFHLAKCLEENNINAIRADLAKRPVKQIDGSASKNDIINMLHENGIINDNPVIIKLWGTGNPKREFLHSSDMADACLFIMENLTFSDLKKNINGDLIRNTHINIGTGKGIAIRELAETIKNITGFKGNTEFNTDMPDGTPIKIVDISKLLQYGWQNSISLKQGLEMTYNDYKQTLDF
jgi:GDP-L-fucose synthase